MASRRVIHDWTVEWPIGRFVVSVEGIDGAGKTSLVRGLATALESQPSNLRVAVTSEFASPLGSAIRDALPELPPLARAYAFAAERHWTIVRVAGVDADVVLWDRYVDSSIATRMADVAVGRGDPELVDVGRELAARLPRPHMTLLLQLPARLAIERVATRDRAVPSVYDVVGLAALGEAFDACVAEDPGRFVKLDATGSPEEVLEQAYAAVSNMHEVERAGGPRPP